MFPEHGTRNLKGKGHVLIVGVSTRAAAESAARAGFEVVALDAYADLDQHPSVRALSVPRDFGATFSPQATVAAARDFRSDAVMYLSSFENHPKAVDALATGRQLWGNRPEVLRRVRDPEALSAAFARRAIRAPRVVTDRRATSLPVDVEQWVLKPRASGGGHDVRLWRPGEPVASGHYLQEFVGGIPASVIFVAAGGCGVALGVTRQLAGDGLFGSGGFRYCGNILLARLDLVADAIALVDVVASEFSLAGVGSIDVIAGEDSLYPVEVNPRWSASMELVERARDVSVFGLHVDACVAGALPAFDLQRAPAPAALHGKAIVFAREDVVIGDTRAWLDDSDLRDVPREGDRIAAGQPICTVFASGSDEGSCYAKLVERAERVYRLVRSWGPATLPRTPSPVPPLRRASRRSGSARRQAQ